MTDPHTLSHEEMLARISETVQKTRELVDEAARLLGQYSTVKARENQCKHQSVFDSNPPSCAICKEILQ